MLQRITPNHVYAVDRVDGLIKIGFTRVWLSERVKQLNRQYKTELHLIDAEVYGRGEDALIRERELHRIFREYRIEGEWFAISRSMLAAYFPTSRRKEILWRAMHRLKVPSAA